MTDEPAAASLVLVSTSPYLSYAPAMAETQRDASQTNIILGPPFQRRWHGAAGYSIKAYACGRVPFHVGRRRYFVDDQHFG